MAYSLSACNNNNNIIVLLLSLLRFFFFSLSVGGERGEFSHRINLYKQRVGWRSCSTRNSIMRMEYDDNEKTDDVYRMEGRKKRKKKGNNNIEEEKYEKIKYDKKRKRGKKKTLDSSSSRREPSF